eukprot:SRR837773.21958.p1 GENE.SRR837773.21958~~SRR837773.21958.p1  ORF type:complete len:248 (-),score=93.09 SRR837773.21958:105-812(-)
MDQDSIGKSLAAIEHQWGQEIKTLKEELHQTILAHNHNADLIKIHKESIDDLRTRVTRLQNGGAGRAAADLKAQYAKLEALPKQPPMQRLEPLLERLSKLEMQVHLTMGRAAAGGKGLGRNDGMLDAVLAMGGMGGMMPLRAPRPGGNRFVPPGMHGAGFMGAPGFPGAAALAGKGKGAGRGAMASAAAVAAYHQAATAQFAQAQAQAALMANPEALAAAMMANAAELGGDDDGM